MRFKKILHSPASMNHSLNARSPLIQPYLESLNWAPESGLFIALFAPER